MQCFRQITIKIQVVDINQKIRMHKHSRMMFKDSIEIAEKVLILVVKR